MSKTACQQGNRTIPDEEIKPNTGRVTRAFSTRFQISCQYDSYVLAAQ